MISLTFDHCTKIGIFQKPHGISGSLLLIFDPEWELSIENADIFITETDGLPVPWFVPENGIRITSPTTAIVDLEWIHNQSAAKRICGHAVYLKNEKIIQPVNEILPSGWSGFELSDESGHLFGKISGEVDYAGNHLLLVETKKGEVMVPLHQDLILSVDTRNMKLKMVVPEGLMNL
jgi:16S rRNA processing protein RimM